MLSVAEKYSLFNSTPQSISELQKFLQNYELLQTFLGVIDGKLGGELSQLKEISAKVNQVNALMEEIATFPLSGNVFGSILLIV
jgi:hypothetical protein